MINIGKMPVNFQCPSCGFSNKATIKQIRINDIIICRGCKANLKLQDHFDTVKKTLRSLRREIAHLEDQIKNWDVSKFNYRRK